mmetsp:Transcript_84951/g.274616  ORF Transcript_84951/g.274616 Transcript_84951/m.274616 type:complete len:201 (-) Transcript_84951:981-1583(-)
MRHDGAVLLLDVCGNHPHQGASCHVDERAATAAPVHRGAALQHRHAPGARAACDLRNMPPCDGRSMPGSAGTEEAMAHRPYLDALSWRRAPVPRQRREHEPPAARGLAHAEQRRVQEAAVHEDNVGVEGRLCEAPVRLQDLAPAPATLRGRRPASRRRSLGFQDVRQRVLATVGLTSFVVVLRRGLLHPRTTGQQVSARD